MSADVDWFDYPDDPTPEPAPPPVHDPPPRPAVDHDDDEAAFWRGVREGTDRPPDRREERPCSSNYAEWIASERRVAYTVPCPMCKVGVNDPCVRIDYHGQPIHPPEPLRKLPAHDARLKAARKTRR